MDALRILLISPFFPPQPSVASLRAHSFARAWADAGDSVTVLTTVKRLDQTGLNLPRGGMMIAEVEDDVPRALEWMRGRSRPSAAISRRGGVRKRMRFLSALRARTGIFSAVRMPDLTDWWVEQAIDWCVRCGGEWDVAVSCGGPYTAHVAAMALKRRRFARHWVADYRDLWTQHPLYRGLFPWTMRERALERSVLREVDAVTTVSDGLAARLRAHTRRPVHVITNGYDADAITALPVERILQRERDGVTRLVYTGSLYPRGQDAAPLLRAMTYLQTHRPDLSRRLRLVIAGGNRDAWMRPTDAHGVLPMLDFRGDVPWGDSLRLQRDADALVLIDWRDAGQGVLTGKLFEYLASKPPVLVIGGAADSPAASMVLRAGRGTVFGQDDVAIRSAIETLIGGGAIGADRRDDAFIAQFTRQKQAMRMYDVLHSMCAQ